MQIYQHSNIAYPNLTHYRASSKTMLGSTHHIHTQIYVYIDIYMELQVST